MKTMLFYLVLVGQLFALEPADKANDEMVFPVATIIKMDGKVKILPVFSIKKHTAKVGEGLLKGDRLITYADTKAVIELLDHSKIILNENVEMVLSSDSSLAQESGEVYYKINKRAKSHGLSVETPFSIIGIKGTEFIVDFENEGQIALNEGLIDITSPGEKFELYKAKEMSAFEKYQREQEAGFEAYKRKLDDEIAAYVQSFELSSNKILSFSSSKNCKENCEKQVVEEPFDKKIIARFKAYQEMAGE